MDKFMASPAACLTPKPTQSPVRSVPKASGYTCPMHPEVHRDGPGECPKCDMVLERALTQILHEKAEALQAEDQTVMYVASDGRLAGFVAVSDPTTASTVEAIEQLKKGRASRLLW